MAEPIVTCKIDGAALQRELERMAHPDAIKVLRAALGAGAAPVLKEMQREATKDTGFLAEHFNIKFSMKGKDVQCAVFIGPQGKMDYPLKGGRFKDKINSSGRHYKSGRISVTAVARFFEFGTEKLGADPFISRSFNRQKENALFEIIRTLRTLLFANRS